jgi:23S rRNA pseudouridine1911/1915/1917 synthase
VKILFEDEHLIVLEKPEGLLSVATDFDNTSSLHSILKQRFHKQRVFPVHRLDRETSGVIVFAYTDSARKRLKEQFEQHSVKKTYYAIVEGRPSESKGTWESYLEEDERYFVSSAQMPGSGKLAITHYETVSVKSEMTLLRLHPVTGKKHQLRVHCKEAGLPIVGDQRYGTGKNPIQRLCLHAQKLSFTHPFSQKKMSFEIPLPASFSKLYCAR